MISPQFPCLEGIDCNSLTCGDLAHPCYLMHLTLIDVGGAINISSEKQFHLSRVTFKYNCTLMTTLLTHFLTHLNDQVRCPLCHLIVGSHTLNLLTAKHPLCALVALSVGKGRHKYKCTKGQQQQVTFKAMI